MHVHPSFSSPRSLTYSSAWVTVAGGCSIGNDCARTLTGYTQLVLKEHVYQSDVNRVSLPSLYAIPEQSLSDRSEHNAAAPKNNDIVPNVPKTMEEFPDDRKDISDYFGLDDFLLRVHVTSGLQYAFDDQAVGADQKKLEVIKSSFLKFLHKRLYFFSSMLHIAYGFIALGTLLHNAGSTCRTEPDVSFCSTKSICAGVICSFFSILNFLATRSYDYAQASFKCRTLLHTTYFIQGMTLVIVEILSPFPKYFRVTLHLAFGYSFFPLDPC